MLVLHEVEDFPAASDVEELVVTEAANARVAEMESEEDVVVAVDVAVVVLMASPEVVVEMKKVSGFP